MPQHDDCAVRSVGKFICRRDFSCQGHSFKEGQEFKFRSISISDRRVRQMWDSRWISTESEVAREKEVLANRTATQKKSDVDATAAILASRERAGIVVEPVVAADLEYDAPGDADIEADTEEPEAKPERARKAKKTKATKGFDVSDL